MKKIVLAILFLSSFCVQAQPTAVEGETAYNFWIQFPKQEILENKPPVLIFLHGKSLSGKDLNRVKRYGVLKAIEKGLEIPAIVVAPQLPSGPWIPEKVNEVLEYVMAHYEVDPTRIYVAGMSLGSYGTMSFLGQYPDKIAAAVSICGGGEIKDACNLSTIPIAVYHGDKDFIVPVSESRKIVNAIKKCNKDAPVDFHILKGENHGTIENLFRKKDIYDWMFKHKKSIQTQS
ncbi:prolyl oligopeptidase family serine peptidase [Myroides ceti]|uniref:Prolyl oligopeptidase family serine peptidase n=1 Tax=Paenimyroides ceti TaxID=395087 RepID=A0ABT8CV07_9FLAO|nr:prolyl oligopeptidase family serine peptidase [Paenimyroides ceti]MDN3707032.1 prolyl oligopeptidase family serine peptidase [Paenimyroides ceti]